MVFEKHTTTSVRFRTLPSRGWTHHAAESALKGRKRLARFVRYPATGS
jgi:hypothetical protein